MRNRARWSLSLRHLMLGVPKSYVQRLSRWPVILLQVHGASLLEQVKLIASAISAPLVSLRKLSTWQDPVLLFDSCVTVRSVGRFRLRRFTDDLWHVVPWRERAIHQMLQQLLRPGDVFIDAGANIGVYTLLASRLVGPTGRVLAIEMMPDTADILRRHVSENGCKNVTIFERALSHRANSTVIARVIRGKFGQASIAQFGRGEGDFEELEVQTATLDDLCRGLDQIRLIKLDLEGAELPALAGSKSVMEKTESVIYESHTSSDELAKVFWRAGFHISRDLGKDRLASRGPELRG